MEHYENKDVQRGKKAAVIILALLCTGLLADQALLISPDMQSYIDAYQPLEMDDYDAE
jgi:hypothetical protein